MTNTLPDINAQIAGLLLDLAAIHDKSPRRWGYARAARAIRFFPHAVSELTEVERMAVAGIGPATLRLIQEVLEHGDSPGVARAIDDSPAGREILAKRATRAGFFSAALKTQILAAAMPDAVSLADCLGDFQMHTTDSDGVETLEAMIEACRARGYAHSAVTDHSVGLRIAHGMSLEDMRRQHQRIDALNAKNGGDFRMFKGIEANILDTGQLDLTADDRRGIELVVASPHSKLRVPGDQTDRLLTAITQPGVHILGHPRGRVYNTRVGIAADWPAIFRRAAETGVAIELDGDPSRQDVDAALASEALKAGCVFALDSDAHSTDQLDYVEYAVAHARVAAIPPARVINCWSVDQLLDWSASAWSSSREGTRPRRTTMPESTKPDFSRTDTPGSGPKREAGAERNSPSPDRAEKNMGKPDPETVAEDEERDDRFQATDN